MSQSYRPWVASPVGEKRLTGIVIGLVIGKPLGIVALTLIAA